MDACGRFTEACGGCSREAPFAARKLALAKAFELRQATVLLSASLAPKMKKRLQYVAVCLCPHEPAAQCLQGGLSKESFAGGCHGGAFSVHSTCIQGYSEVPSVHSDFKPCLRPCVFVDLGVGAIRPTTLLIILEGETVHVARIPPSSTPRRLPGGTRPSEQYLAHGL